MPDIVLSSAQFGDTVAIMQEQVERWPLCGTETTSLRIRQRQDPSPRLVLYNIPHWGRRTRRIQPSYSYNKDVHQFDSEESSLGGFFE